MNEREDQPLLQILLLIAGVSVLLAVLLAGHTHALPETYVSEDGSLTFNYPAGWVSTDQAGAPFIASDPEALSSADGVSDSVMIAIIPPSTETGSYLDLVMADADTPLHAVEALASLLSVSSPDVELGEPVAKTIGRRDAAQIRMTNEHKTEALIIVLAEGDGDLLQILAASPVGDLQQFEPTIMAIVATIHYTPPVIEQEQ